MKKWEFITDYHVETNSNYLRIVPANEASWEDLELVLAPTRGMAKSATVNASSFLILKGGKQITMKGPSSFRFRRIAEITNSILLVDWSHIWRMNISDGAPLNREMCTKS